MKVRFLLSSTFCLVSATAMADQIDGSWCDPKTGQRLEIQGPSITTPDGKTLAGDYSRHAFFYVDGEIGDIRMRQLSDELMLRKVADGAEEEWHRCDLQTS